MSQVPVTDRVWDVAIVGAGISGLYCGWRYLSANPGAAVAIFENSRHVGGRLLSATPPGISNMNAELGGMRIMSPHVQPLVNALRSHLNRNATPDQYIGTFSFPVSHDENIAYLRGTHLRNREFKTAPDKVPYRLAFIERGKDSSDLMVQAIEQIVPGITQEYDDTERRRMARETVFKDLELYKQGFWQVLFRVMSGEAYQLAVDAGGYQSVLANWNAADAIPWFLADFGRQPDGKAVEYLGFRNGFRHVALRVAEKFRAAGGEIFLGARLTGFHVKGGVVALSFPNGDDEPVLARKLILAMPRRALELLSPRSPLLREPKVLSLIGSVTAHALLKLFITYEYPWWVPAGVAAGRTTTDLPVRQTYYWPTNDGGRVVRGPAMVMASYDDGISVGFWDAFRDKRGVDWGRAADAVGRKETFFGPAERAAESAGTLDPLWRENRPPRVMVEEMQRQLMAIHGLAYLPEPQAATYRDWGDDPFGGGWNSWNIGVKSWEVKEQIVQPDGNAPVFVCGEAYSDAQGWVEGALQTAEAVLDKLRVPPLVPVSAAAA